MVFKWLGKLIGDPSKKKIEVLRPLIEQINSLEPQMKSLGDNELRAKTTEFKERRKKGETLDALLPEAYAVVREASVRTIGLRHFDVQLMGGIVLHQGKIAEMKTGEGKTLVATLPIYLNALEEKGAHLITVNDYLAKRDSEWMGPIYTFLGLRVGLIQHHMDYAERRVAYSTDVTYGTNNEFGFDYLRDNMAVSIEQCVQRDLHYSIVDEVDSILIDEARTPLIISGMIEDTVQGYQRANQLTRSLQKEKDFTVDEKTKNASLTEEGMKKVEKILNIESLYDTAHMDIAHQIAQSLKAWHLFKRDIDYVIKDNEVIIVDEFTGRLMFGRRYSDGLHQAIEAKERVPIKEESQTLAAITFQNYFRLYRKLAGMTGTAMTEEAEFGKIYDLEAIAIPTHMPMIRNNLPDVIYKTRKEKFKAAVSEIEDWYKKKRPVLVGTISIENSEVLSEMLRHKGIPHHVLNAKHHEKEAEIVARAGQSGQVTIATNMAGRGTDIVLGEGVVGVGGLHIIGTERHESRRIDNQLRGRAGRQGDPGSSRFYVSLEDDLMRLFGSARIAGMMDRLGIEEDTPIEHNLITRAIEKAQQKVEQYHFSIRKQILEFDDVMNKQRETIYALRRRILEEEELKEKIEELMEALTTDLVSYYLPEKIRSDDWELEGLREAMSNVVGNIDGQLEGIRKIKDRKEIEKFLLAPVKSAHAQRESEIGEEAMREIERLVMLKVIDTKWIEHLDNMDNLREGIGLRAYGQRDPLIEYKIEAYQMFQEMMRTFREEVISLILRVQLVKEEPVLHAPRIISYGEPSAPQPQMRKEKKVGRNDPCPCGSGKKYKKCCGKTT